MLWIFIFEDGQVFKTDVAPSPEDLRAVDEGILTILAIRHWMNSITEVTQEGEIPVEYCLYDIEVEAHTTVAIEDPNQ